MKASEFIKNIGWDKAINIVSKSLHIGMFKYFYIGKVDSEQLEILVESKQMLNEYGVELSTFIKNYCADLGLCSTNSDTLTLVERIFKSAVADVESCQ